MAMIGKVKRMYFREKKSVREIVRLTSLSRNTVRKWLKAAVLEEPRYRRSEAPGKLTPFHESLRLALKVDAHRPRHERRTARALHTQIRAEGYVGGYSRVTDFVRAWRQGEGQSISTKAFVPLAFELGEAFQFDWSEEGLVVGGIYYRMQVSHLKLCASRAFWLVAYPSQGHEMLFDAHTRSFAALGGIALTIAVLVAVKAGLVDHVFVPTYKFTSFIGWAPVWEACALVALVGLLLAVLTAGASLRRYLKA